MREGSGAGNAEAPPSLLGFAGKADEIDKEETAGLASVGEEDGAGLRRESIGVQQLRNGSHWTELDRSEGRRKRDRKQKEMWMRER